MRSSASVTGRGQGGLPQLEGCWGKAGRMQECRRQGGAARESWPWPRKGSTCLRLEVNDIKGKRGWVTRAAWACYSLQSVIGTPKVGRGQSGGAHQPPTRLWRKPKPLPWATGHIINLLLLRPPS